jgi:hypothetical protein
VGNSHNNLIAQLKNEGNRIEESEIARINPNYAKFMTVKTDDKNIRTVEYDSDSIKNAIQPYAGTMCILSNDKSIKTAIDALNLYQIQNRIKNDFNNIGNFLDTKYLHLSDKKRLEAKLFIQFLAEIYLSEIRVRMEKSALPDYVELKEVLDHLDTIYKVKAENSESEDKYSEMLPVQRDTLKHLLGENDVDKILGKYSKQIE